MNIRAIIKTEMGRLGAERYRITASNEVHFYGDMPNSHRRGWYLKHYDAADYAEQILSDIALSEVNWREIAFVGWKDDETRAWYDTSLELM